MKKNVSFVIGLATFLLMAGLTSCLSTSSGFVDKAKYDEVSQGLYSKKLAEGQIENPTPENSVLVYGFTSENGAKFWYKDENSDWEVTAESKGQKLILPPVPKGAKLVLKQGGYFLHESTGYYYDALGRMRADVTDTWYPVTNDEWNVKLASDKSLCFMGIHSVLMPGLYNFEGMQTAVAKKKSEGGIVAGFPKTQAEYDAFVNKQELSILKQLLKDYKGTDWEPVINERITELSKN